MTGKFTYPNFLGIGSSKSLADKALFHVIPAPFEKTVSWKTGTAGGPSAILEASAQVEHFDGISTPMEAGIHTCPAIACKKASSKQAVDRIAKTVSGVVKKKKIPVVLGGEHTVTLGAVRAVAASEKDFGVVQFDAHADLRDEYEGSSLSHACVMHRIVETGIPIHQIGVRSYCAEERSLRKNLGIGHIDAARLAERGVPRSVLTKAFPKRIYITFDVDAFDPSIMPATGTPEPGGLLWYDTLAMLRSIIKGRQVIGFDVVELSPTAGLHHCEFTAAKLIYAIMGMILKEKKC